MTEKDALYFGALLHDMGKFPFRAQATKEGDNHEKLGEEFIREHLGKCKALEGFIPQIITAANRQIANVWSADTVTAKEREYQASKQTRRPLASIFSRIAVKYTEKEIRKNPSGIFYHNPTAITDVVEYPTFIEGDISTWKPNENEIIQQHNELWNAFLDELAKLRNISTFSAFQTAFFALLHKYTTKVCSAGYLSYPDINLFDHSRMVASVAMCLEQAEDDGNPIILIKGDISGIQSFIYEGIEMKEIAKPAKQLRGRSFFISILTDTIAQYFVREFGLYEANILYNGGGHFLMMIPNNRVNKEKMSKVEEHLNSVMFDRYDGNLQMVLASVQSSSVDIITEFGNVYHRLEEKMGMAKRQKSKSILEKVMSNPISQARKQQKNDIDYTDFEKVGQVLPKADYLVEVVWKKEHQFQTRYDEAAIDFPELNSTWVLCAEENVEKILSRIANVEKVTLHKLNDTDFIEERLARQQASFPIAFNFKFIGNVVPLSPIKEPLSFEEVAALDNPDYPLLAIARMDVDNLGAIFGLGLKEQQEDKRKYTISRIASLSRELHHFFCGSINHLAQKHDIYLAYSGGDDLFAVGALNPLLDFAEEVRESFRVFTCGNPNLSISGGIIACKSHYPIHAAARLAGEAEKEAKSRKDKSGTIIKDGVSIFDCVIGWEELRKYRGMGDDLLVIIDHKESTLDKEQVLPRSFIHALLENTQKCIDAKGKLNMIQVEKTTRYLHYQFARRGVTDDKLKEKDAAYKFQFAKYFLKSDQEQRARFYKHFVIPASLVLYKTRTLKTQ
jgi:CRISPR-associated protein Csm1